MPITLEDLESLIDGATGPSDRLDREIAAVIEGSDGNSRIPAYTASVDECIALVKNTLPEWHWHLGHGPMGIVPYASMSRDDKDANEILVQASAPTVPLALLSALVKALNSG